MLFGGLSGSATADSAALGSIIIPAMAREGYPPAFAAALTSSTASIGIIVPPSITMIIYGSVAGVSVGALFVAGIIPGILVVLVQGLTVYAIARSRGWGGDAQFSWRGLGKAIRDAWLALHHAADHHRRNRVRGIHADRGRRGGCRVWRRRRIPCFVPSVCAASTERWSIPRSSPRSS